jgi:hypothetical protein
MKRKKTKIAIEEHLPYTWLACHITLITSSASPYMEELQGVCLNFFQ